ncbi:MAG: ABC transporter permease subunit [Candidatus Viridilinea halotolerans]|uniref:ABC transporter permease subunit n=1 Tax=Candidatus Viridilinea halotolerans TaxID=2491704 RepID=A0A426TWB9_9CHLR|nr:MAG: ABC transporter permease subunit [Candidatus Viridilinea halotolerans]
MTRRRAQVGLWLALLPALSLIGLLMGVSLAYGVAQSLGALARSGTSQLSLDAYRNVLGGTGPAGREFWPALGFSLWVSLASTGLAAFGALFIAAALNQCRYPTKGATLLMLNLNLAFPHLVWAVALSLLLAQSGLLARIAFALGLIEAPAQFPVLVRDRYGWGIILHYVSKEIPFLLLIVLAVLRTQGAQYDLVAENLGATAWQRLRYVTLPLVLPALAAGSALVFAFVFGAYEVPALLGVRYPRMLTVLALEFFTNPDLNRRAEGMAISLIISLVTLVVVGLGNIQRKTRF